MLYLPDAQERPWQVLARLSKILSLLLIGILLMCAGMSTALVLAYFLPKTGLIWVLVFGMLNAGLIFLFLKIQQKGNRIYHRFMAAVEQRHQMQKTTQIKPESQKILQQYLFKIQNTWIKWVLLIFLMPLLGLSAYHHYQTNQTFGMPSKVSESIANLIRLKKDKIEKYQQFIIQSEDKIKTAKREYARQYTQLEQAKSALIFQSNAFYQAQRLRQQLDKFYQTLNTQAKSVAEKETMLRQNEQIYAQAKGAVEVSLALKGEEEAQAEELIRQEGKLYEAFQTLRIRQDNSLAKAQKALIQEQARKKELEKKVESQKQILIAFLKLTDDYCHQQQKVQQELQKLSKTRMPVKK